MGTLVTFSLVGLYYILAKVSERFGSVLRMPPLYRWFYVAEFFAGLAAVAHLTQASVFLTQGEAVISTRTPLLQANSLEFSLVFYHLPLVISVTIGIIITWKYWGWLITDRKK